MKGEEGWYNAGMTMKKRSSANSNKRARGGSVDALLATMTKTIADLSTAVSQSSKAASTRMDSLEEALARQFGAIAEDFDDQSGTMEIIGDNVVALAAAMAAAEGDADLQHHSLASIERRLGGIELGLDALNRRSENDTHNLLDRVAALEAAAR